MGKLVLEVAHQVLGIMIATSEHNKPKSPFSKVLRQSVLQDRKTFLLCEPRYHANKRDGVRLVLV
jgi:hypothetical protein